MISKAEEQLIRNAQRLGAIYIDGFITVLKKCRWKCPICYQYYLATPQDVLTNKRFLCSKCYNIDTIIKLETIAKSKYKQSKESARSKNTKTKYNKNKIEKRIEEEKELIEKVKDFDITYESGYTGLYSKCLWKNKSDGQTFERSPYYILKYKRNITEKPTKPPKTKVKIQKQRKIEVCTKNHRSIPKNGNSLLEKYPEIAKELDEDKSGFKASEVTFASSKKAIWNGKCGHTWKTKICNKTRGSGCPICKGYKILVGFNDLKTWCQQHNREDLLTEWDYDKNSITPYETTAGQDIYIWWKCKHGHSWKTRLNHRTNKTTPTTCPKCNHIKNGLRFKGNGKAIITEQKMIDKAKLCGAIYLSNYSRINIKCNWKCKCGNIFKRTPSEIFKGRILCKSCSKSQKRTRVATPLNNIIQEANKIGAIYIGDYKNKSTSCTWKCPQCNRIFNRRPVEIIGQKRILCNKCVTENRKKLLCSPKQGKSLLDKYPELAAELDEIKSGFKASDVSCTSYKTGVWNSKCGHIYAKPIYQRIINYKYKNRNGSGCPYCANIKLLVGFNDLYTYCIQNNKEYILAEWDIHKNLITPKDIVYGSVKKIWWNCNNGHSYYSNLSSRIRRNSGCPICKESQGEKVVVQTLDKYGIKYERWYYGFLDLKDKGILELDFYLPDLNTAIEYNGEQHYHLHKAGFGSKDNDRTLKRFNTTQKHDKIKQEYCSKNNIKLIIIRYDDKRSIEEILKTELPLA